MNLLDVGILSVALGAAFGGWRLGFIARLFAWAGVAVGLAVLHAASTSATRLTAIP